MKRVSLCTLIWVLIIFLPTISQAVQTKGIKVVIKDRSGREVGLYKGSHALLIGVSRYTAGWPSLESVPGEIDRIEAALKIQSFHVEKVLNPTSDQLSTAFENFIDRYGFDRDNRLLFFFSGHGHTRKEGKKGYLVPTDAPDPRYDDKGFVRKALGMAQVLTWARRIEAKHALFIFDSCFSGTIFRAKALPKHPPHISDVTSRPVRQFISAGSAGEEVPAQSVFVPSFIRALRGEADLDGDGYVTGTELGMYLHKKVLLYEKGQTPQYGKIKDPDLDEGDFVFLLASPPPVIKQPRTAKESHSTLSVKYNVKLEKVVFYDEQFYVQKIKEDPTEGTLPFRLFPVKKIIREVDLDSKRVAFKSKKGYIPKRVEDKKGNFVDALKLRKTRDKKTNIPGIKANEDGFFAISTVQILKERYFYPHVPDSKADDEGKLNFYVIPTKGAKMQTKESDGTVAIKNRNKIYRPVLIKSNGELFTIQIGSSAQMDIRTD